jgi:MinD superfamily P-loop ATPase
MKIAIASGKGGTGKTTVSVNLFHFLAKFHYGNIHLIDCDVEEPNDIFFFKDPELIKKEEVFRLIPEIDNEACTYCKKCEEWCEFNAITIIAGRKYAEVNANLCHSCGACILACNFGAITEKNDPLGTISHYKIENGADFSEGCLKIGSAMQTPLIKKLKQNSIKENSITILDAPPGTSCPVVETVADVDFVILVTEPTPFGLNDLKIMVELLNEINKPFGVIINKAGLGSNEIYNFLENNNIELLAEIPFSREYAEQYSSGDLLDNISEETEKTYKKIIERIL